MSAVANQVSIRAHQQPPYRWATARFTWDSLSAKKPWKESSPIEFALSAHSKLAVSEQLVADSAKRASEQMTLADSVEQQVTVEHVDRVKFSLGHDTGVTFARQFGQSLKLADTAHHQWQKDLLSSLTLLGSVALDSIKSTSNALGFSSTFGRAIEFDRAFESAFACLAKEQHAVTCEFFSEIPLKSETSQRTELHQQARLAITSALGRVVAYRLGLEEGLEVQTAVGKSLQLTNAEAIALVEQYRRHANGVVSDMLIAASALSKETFDGMFKTGQPPGYTPFRDFMPGDYSYRRALFRAILETTSADRAYIEALRVTVDVPDVLDRGTGHITDPAAGIAVSFTRSFNVPPEVTLTHKGGTRVAIARLKGPVNTKGFSAMLEDLNGNLLAGSFTWVAQGY